MCQRIPKVPDKTHDRNIHICREEEKNINLNSINISLKKAKKKTKKGYNKRVYVIK